MAFFEKDPIEWREHPIGDLYKKLFALKKANTALWNGGWGARMVPVPNSISDKVFSFVRQNEHDKVFAVINFSDTPQKVTFVDGPFQGQYNEYFSNEKVSFSESTQLEIKPWGYQIFVQ